LSDLKVVQFKFSLLLQVLAWAVLGVTLASCSSGSQSTLDTMRLAFKGDLNAAQFEPSNPAFQYLKVTVHGRPAFLVLGYLEQHDATEVWYSAKGEVIKLQAGRLTGALGLETEWRQVSFTGTPEWSELVQSRHQRLWQYQRVRDVMPGYVSSLTDRLTLTQLPYSQVQKRLGPLVHHLAGKSELRWFEEAGAKDLPAAVYAVDALTASSKVVFTYHCVSLQLCMALEPWAPARPALPDVSQRHIQPQGQTTR
jgi:hypothetical protein